MAYDLNRFVNLTILLSQNIQPEQFFEIIIKEAMRMCNCDGGTIYTMGKDELIFRYVFTQSKYVGMTSESGATLIRPVPLNRSYACAYSALTKQRLNIVDIYHSDEFDFSGAMEYDRMNNYHTRSMLVVPMQRMDGKVVGVLQLINAMTGAQVISFTKDMERMVVGLASVAGLYIDNAYLRRKLKKT